MNSNGNSNNIEKIKSYLKRLDAGENLESNKLSISTVNPEDTVSKNTTRVYITKISDWEANYEGMTQQVLLFGIYSIN